MLDGRESVDAVRELTGGRGADLVFDFVGTDQTHADSMAMLARGGTYSVVGFGGMVTVPSAGVRRQRAHGRRATSSAPGSTSGRSCSCTRPARLVLKTEMHPLDSVNEVLAKLHDGEITGRAVLVPG